MLHSIASEVVEFESVQKAFSLQAEHFDEDDKQNIVLQDMREQVYHHVAGFIKNHSRILELNAGSGIDALHFTKQHHTVHATDVSEGMIQQIQKKILNHQLSGSLTCQKLSYDQLGELDGKKFDYVFSNFGGVNCIDDLSKITKHLPALLQKGAYITWVIMPVVCPWEILRLLKGKKNALRRFKKDGVMAHLEGEYFKTYYYSLSQIKKAFGPNFTFRKSEGLSALSPPPSRGDFPIKHPKFYDSLRKLDSALNGKFPFNQWADHIIVTFQFQP